MRLGDHGTRSIDKPPTTLVRTKERSVYFLNLSETAAPENDPAAIPKNFTAAASLNWS